MKNIIIRRPFVTKAQKREAYANIVCARAYATLAASDDAPVEATLSALLEATRYWKKAAKLLGFRNIEDMERYKQIHGTL